MQPNDSTKDRTHRTECAHIYTESNISPYLYSHDVECWEPRTTTVLHTLPPVHEPANYLEKKLQGILSLSTLFSIWTNPDYTLEFVPSARPVP